jgi:hypothetical protein
MPTERHADTERLDRFPLDLVKIRLAMLASAQIVVSVGKPEESTMLVLSPTVSTRAEALPIAPREANLEGQVWGFVDTSKVNADLFIEILKREIANSYRPKDFVVVRKQAPGLALTTEQIGLLEKCRFVIFCFGD